MPSTVALTVARYRPEQESEPTFQTYEVPFRKDWVVLDALNYIKDRHGRIPLLPVVVPDGRVRQLRDDGEWQAEADLRRLPVRLACLGPIRVEPLNFFPVIRDLVVDITDFLRKLTKVKPWIIREKEWPLEEGEYRQTRTSWTPTSSSACASTACSVTRPARSSAWSRVRRARGDRPGPALQPGLARRGRPRND